MDRATQRQPTEAASDDIEQLLTLLAATPRRLASMSQSVDEERLYFKPDETAWSANEILAHLRANAEVRGKSILAMIAQDHPTIRYVSPRGWMRKTNYHNQGFRESLETFTRQRAELLQELNPLKRADWSRGATFTATTRGREETIMSYVRRITDHECVHFEQLEVLLHQEKR
jgi:hypothetical protein